MDVYSWWARAHFEPDQWEVAEAAWKAATLAERERCAGVCLRFRLDLAHDKAADIVEELTDAIRNP